MILYHLDGQFVLAVNTLEGVRAVYPEGMLRDITKTCIDVTLHGRRFRVWTDDVHGLKRHIADCHESRDAERQDDEVATLGEYGLLVELLSGYPDSGECKARVLVERSEYTGDCHDCVARLALFAATEYAPDACRRHIEETF